MAFFIWQSAASFVVYHYALAFQTFAKKIVKSYLEDFKKTFICKKCIKLEGTRNNVKPEIFIIKIPTKTVETTGTNLEDLSLREAFKKNNYETMGVYFSESPSRGGVEF